jgi:hypothetical protein
MTITVSINGGTPLYVYSPSIIPVVVESLPSTPIYASAVGVVGPAGPAGADGVGIPAGGTTGQILKKTSGTDYDTEWSGSVPSLQFEGGTGAEGTLTWNDVDGTLDLIVKGEQATLQIGQEFYVRIVNKTGGDLLEADYAVVRIRTVSEGGAQGQRLAAVLAQADTSSNSRGVLGVVTEDIPVNQEGFVTLLGQVKGINTTATGPYGESWQDGDILYLSPTVAGGLTNVAPSHPDYRTIIGYVEYAHQNQGKLFVKPQVGIILDDIHDVLISSPSNNDVLQYNSVSGAWENSAPPWLENIVEDTTPQLGGTLDAQTNNITNLGSINGTAASTIISGAAAGATALQNVVEDTTPQLGGTLETQGNPINNSAGVALQYGGNTKLITISTGIRTAGTVNVNGVYSLPTADGSSGDSLVTDGAGTISFVNTSTIQVTGVTVLSSAWSLVGSFYEADISNGNILSTSIVDVIPSNADYSTVTTAQVLPATSSSSGSVKIYAVNSPGADITVTLNISRSQ